MKFFKFVVLLVVAMIGTGTSLMCHNCLSTKSFDDCELMGLVLQCNATIANANHESFKEDNPTLAQGNGTDFKCYRMAVARLFPNNTDTGIRGYARGCTFNTTNFCSGWHSSLNVTSCGTCLVDNCDRNPVNTTEAPGQTTVTPVMTTPTLAPGQTTVSPVVTTPTLAPGQTTVSPVVTTPTLAPGQSTAAPVVTTSTKKPGTGAGVILQSSIMVLMCTSVMLIFVGR